MKIHQIIPVSTCNGPGKRFVIWVQGCTLKCPGCFNQDSHGPNGKEMSVSELLGQIALAKRDHNIEGITITGGEPLQQASEVAELVNMINIITNLTTILLTGFYIDEARKIEKAQNLKFLNYVDVLLAGRYDQDQRLANQMRGSSNKKPFFFSNRYTESDMEAVPKSEVIITEEGDIVISGIEPLRMIGS